MKPLLKKFLIATIAIVILSYQNIYAANVESTKDGDWAVGSTWVAGTIPQDGDNAIILHSVTISSNITEVIQDIVITGGGVLVLSGTGTITTVDLIIESDIETSGWTGVLNTTGDFVIEGNFLLSGGTINAGDDVNDMFRMTGILWDWSSGDVNVAGFAELADGEINASANVTMNVSTAGTRDDYRDNIDISENMVFTLGTNTLTININNTNEGTGSEVSTGNYTLNSGTLLSVLKNTSGTPTELVLQATSRMMNIISDIGAGSTLTIEGQGTDTVNTPSVWIKSGLFKVDSVTILTVDGDFYSETLTDTLVIDGILYVNGDLTLDGTPNDIIGDGLVYADNYILGSNEVFWFQPLNGEKSAACTWMGGSSRANDWFDDVNWNKKAPSEKKAVIISLQIPDPPTVAPIIVLNSDGAKAKSIEIIGAGIGLIIEDGGELTVAKSGGSHIGGYLNVGPGTICTVDDGTLQVELDMTVDGGTVTIDNGSVLNIGTNAIVNPGSVMDIFNNSKVNIGEDNW